MRNIPFQTKRCILLGNVVERDSKDTSINNLVIDDLSTVPVAIMSLMRQSCNGRYSMYIEFEDNTDVEFVFANMSCYTIKEMSEIIDDIMEALYLQKDIKNIYISEFNPKDVFLPYGKVFYVSGQVRYVECDNTERPPELLDIPYIEWGIYKVVKVGDKLVIKYQEDDSIYKIEKTDGTKESTRSILNGLWQDELNALRYVVTCNNTTNLPVSEIRTLNSLDGMLSYLREEFTYAYKNLQTVLKLEDSNFNTKYIVISKTSEFNKDIIRKFCDEIFINLGLSFPIRVSKCEFNSPLNITDGKQYRYINNVVTQLDMSGIQNINPNTTKMYSFLFGKYSVHVPWYSRIIIKDTTTNEKIRDFYSDDFWNDLEMQLENLDEDEYDF